MWQELLNEWLNGDGKAWTGKGTVAVARAALREFCDWLDTQRSPTLRGTVAPNIPVSLKYRWHCSACGKWHSNKDWTCPQKRKQS